MDQAGIAPYLLRRRLLSEKSIVDGTVKVVDVSRRNRNFQVVAGAGQSYLLKQGLGRDGIATVVYESRVYEFLRSIPRARSLQRYLPRFYGYDEQERVLILELLKGSRNFQQHDARTRGFSVRSAATLGRALSAFHSLTRFASTGVRADRLDKSVPWALSLHRPGVATFRDISSANLQLIRIIQNTPDFPGMLDELRAGWTADSLIHNDIKWDNCLFYTPPEMSHEEALKLVDWEFAVAGDSCWDIGAVFSSYLSSWLFSIPVSGEEPPDRFLETAECPLPKMQPAMRAYWKAYVRGSNLDGRNADQVLLRAVRYAAARLLQTAFEQMQHSARQTGNVICLVQLGFNILQRPREAIAHLLGISLRDSAYDDRLR